MGRWLKQHFWLQDTTDNLQPEQFLNISLSRELQKVHQVFLFSTSPGRSGNKTKSLLPSWPKGFESTEHLYIRQIKPRPLCDSWNLSFFSLVPKKRAVAVTWRSALIAAICNTRLNLMQMVLITLHLISIWLTNTVLRAPCKASNHCYTKLQVRKHKLCDEKTCRFQSPDCAEAHQLNRPPLPCCLTRTMLCLSTHHCFKKDRCELLCLATITTCFH